MFTYQIYIQLYTIIHKNTLSDSRDLLTIRNNDIFHTTTSLEFIAPSPFTVGESQVCLAKEIEDTDAIDLDTKTTTKVLILTGVKCFARTSDYEQKEAKLLMFTDWNGCCILSI